MLIRKNKNLQKFTSCKHNFVLTKNFENQLPLMKEVSIKYNILLKMLVLSFYICTFFFLYLQGKEKRKYERKKKTRRFSTSSLRSAVSFFCLATPNLLRSLVTSFDARVEQKPSFV